MRYSKGKTKREAILAALESYNRRHRMAELVKFSGTFASLMTNEEIEAADRAKTARQRQGSPK